MQPTPSATSSRQRKRLTLPSKKITNAGIVGLSVISVAAGGILVSQNRQAATAATEAAVTYTPAVTYTTPPAPTTVAFLGDSFTAGTGTSARFNRWTTLLSNEQRWLELNYGSGGTNYGTESRRTGSESYAERLTDLILSQPDIVIVSSAGNRLDLNQVAGIRETFQTLHEGLPNAQIVATSPYYRAGQMPSEYEEFAKNIRREVEAVGGEYVDLGHPLLNHPEGVADDGAHPNDVGHRLIAEAVGEALDDAGVATN